MTQYLIKSALVLLTLIILWCIAKRQEELGSEIESLEETAQNQFRISQLQNDIIENQAKMNFTPIVGVDFVKKEPTFKAKKLAEEKRMNKVVKKKAVK